MKKVKESIYEEIIHGQWWDLKSFSDKLGQSNIEQSIKFLERCNKNYAQKRGANSKLQINFSRKFYK